MSHFSTLLKILGHNESQHRDIVKLLHYTGCLGDETPAQILDDVAAGMSLAGQSAKFKTPIETLEWLNTTLQEKMKRRTAERQQIPVDPRLEEKRPELISILDRMDYISEVKPTKNEFDGLLLLGAAQGGVTNRLSEMEKIIDSGVTPETIYLLSGGRHLWANAEPIATTMLAERIAEKSGDNITEISERLTRIFTEELAKNDGRDLTKKRQDIVAAFREGKGIAEGFPPVEWPNEMDSVRRLLKEKAKSNIKLQNIKVEEAFAEGERPSTKDTVTAFYQKYGTGLIERAGGRKVSLITISSQPHIPYQRQPIDEVLPSESFSVEMVGKGANPQTINIGEVLDAFARRVYAGKELAKQRLAELEEFRSDRGESWAKA